MTITEEVKERIVGIAVFVFIVIMEVVGIIVLIRGL